MTSAPLSHGPSANPGTKIRLLFLSHAYVISGALQEKLDALARTEEADVALLAPSLWKSKQWGRTFRLQQWSKRVKVYGVPSIFTGIVGAYMLEPWSVMRAILDFQPDLIQVEQEVFALSSLEIALLQVFHRRPMVFFGWENIDWPRRLLWLRRRTARFVLDSSAAAICGNRGNQDLIRKWGYLGPAWVMPQFGIDKKLFPPTQRHRERDQPFAVAFVGQLTPQKGIDVLLEAIAALQRNRLAIRLIICGVGPFEKDLKSKAQALDLNGCVTWRGFVPPTEVPGVLAGVDALVLPSRTTARWKEQFGLVLIEAMAMGIPVVGSSSGEIPNVIGRPDLIFEEGSSSALAGILESLVRDPGKRDEVAEYCLARVERHFTHERIAEQSLQVYREVLRGVGLPERKCRRELTNGRPIPLWRHSSMHEAAAQDQGRRGAPLGGLSTLQKSACLLRLLPTRPAEFWQRLSTMAEVRAESYRTQPCTIKPVQWPRALAELSLWLQADLDSIMREAELDAVEQEVLRLMRTIPKEAPFASFHNGGLRLARLCYGLARIIRPLAIVETGVCCGVTSAFLLKALQVNGCGVLHSVDLPPLGKDADQFVGLLIPDDLRGNWTLHRGSSKAMLPEVVKDVGQVGLFVHDSLHTYKNMLREFETVQPNLSPRAAVVADDIEGNEAFRDWLARALPQYSVTLQEQSKRSLLGVALFHK